MSAQILARFLNFFSVAEVLQTPKCPNMLCRLLLLRYFKVIECNAQVKT